MPPSLTANRDMVPHETSNQAKVADKPSESSDLTDHDGLKSEVARLHEVCTFVLET